MAGDCIRNNPTTGVLWDIHTCPVPAGFDPRLVRSSIESALEKEFGGPRPVTVYAVGDLDYVSNRLLEEISSSGIFLRHAMFRALSVSDILGKWKRDRRHTHVLLISGDNAWFNKGFYSMGFNILRALPLPRPPPFPTYHPHTKAWVYPTYPDTKEWWFWESLLEEANSGALQICSEVIFKGEPACSCELCGFCSRSCDAFIKHLQSSEHREEACKIEERKYVPLNPSNYEPVLFCNVCNYTGHYHRDMDMHYKSEEHSQKADKVKERKYEPLNSKNYEAVLFCNVCNYTGHYLRDMDMHYKSEEHSQKKRAIQTVAELTLKEEEAPSVVEDAYLRPRRDWHTVFPEEVFVKRLERRERKRQELRKEIQRRKEIQGRKESSRKNSSEPSVTHEKDRPSVAHEKEGPSI